MVVPHPETTAQAVDVERRLRRGRILGFGVPTGFVWTFLSIAVLALVGSAFTASLLSRSTSVQLYLFGSNLAGGIWALWLYALLPGAPRLRFKDRATAAMVIAVAAGAWCYEHSRGRR